MAVSPADLRAIPLFQGITDEHLNELIGVFQHVEVKEGDVLFQAGAKPDNFIVLVKGEIALYEDDVVRFRLRPIAPIGELGSLTGLERTTRAVATLPSELWQIATADLMRFFEKHGDVAFPFYHNLLQVVADKIRRDEHRMAEMRANIIRTQKAMKRLRDLVLESEESSLSKPIYETLEDLIEHNRRWNYMVEPAHTLQAKVRLDDGTLVAVREMSAGWLRLAPLPAVPAAKSDWSGVLIIPNGEIPVSGRVDTVDAASVHIQLDLLIHDYAVMLEDYLTRVQMLDFVV
jgi:CRP-like cAMP-binding protein